MCSLESYNNTHQLRNGPSQCLRSSPSQWPASLHKWPLLTLMLVCFFLYIFITCMGLPDSCCSVAIFKNLTYLLNLFKPTGFPLSPFLAFAMSLLKEPSLWPTVSHQPDSAEWYSWCSSRHPSEFPTNRQLDPEVEADTGSVLLARLSVVLCSLAKRNMMSACLSFCEVNSCCYTIPSSVHSLGVSERWYSNSILYFSYVNLSTSIKRCVHSSAT